MGEVALLFDNTEFDDGDDGGEDQVCTAELPNGEQCGNMFFKVSPDWESLWCPNCGQVWEKE